MEYRNLTGYYYPYKVTEDGRFYVKHGDAWKPVKVQNLDKYKRKAVSIRLSDGEWTNRSATRIIWEAFRGPLKPGECVTTLGGCKNDLEIWNLCVMTKSELSAKAGRTGRNPVEAVSRAGWVEECYPSQKAAAEAAYLTPQAMHYRIKKGVKWQLERFPLAYRTKTGGRKIKWEDDND